MKKKLIELAVNCPVELLDFMNEIHQGYLVYDNDGEQGYLILPFDWHADTIAFFKASHIKSIRLLRNGAVIGGGKRK